MTRILVAYASHFGQTRKIADMIARELRTRGFAVEVADVAEPTAPSPASFDAVVIGSRIELGRHSTSLISYVRAHIDELRELPTAFFVVCNAAARPNAGHDPVGYAQIFFDEVGWRPTLHASFAGALPYRQYNWLLRLIMKRIARNAGHPTDTSRDHELTDWTKVFHFTDQIASLFPLTQAVTHL